MKQLLIILCILLALTACNKKDIDPFKGLRGKTASQLFHNGQTALTKKHYAKAVKNFEALDAIYPFGNYAQKSHRNLIYAYYKNDQPASAVTAADRYIRLYPRAKDLDYAYYMKGMIQMEQGSSWLQKKFHTDRAERDASGLRDAYRAFSTVSKAFPESHYAPDAQKHLQHIYRMLAKRELTIAAYYMKRHAYVAAVNRAAYALKHYPKVPYALQLRAENMMIKAYHALKLPELATRIRVAQAHNKEAAAALPNRRRKK